MGCGGDFCLLLEEREGLLGAACLREREAVGVVEIGDVGITLEQRGEVGEGGAGIFGALGGEAAGGGDQSLLCGVEIVGQQGDAEQCEAERGPDLRGEGAVGKGREEKVGGSLELRGAEKQQSEVVAGDALDLEVVGRAEDVCFFEMSEGAGKIFGLELGEAEEAPGHAEVRREGDDVTQRDGGIGELIGGVLQGGEVPPALLPGGIAGEGLLIVADGGGGLSSFAFAESLRPQGFDADGFGRPWCGRWLLRQARQRAQRDAEGDGAGSETKQGHGQRFYSLVGLERSKFKTDAAAESWILRSALAPARAA